MFQSVNNNREINNLVLVLGGALLLAVGVCVFLQPNQIASGGTPGIAILLNHLAGLSVGSAMLVINVPLLIAGFYFLGQMFVLRTVVAVVAVSLFVDLLNLLLIDSLALLNPLFASVCGGVMIGVGVGLILRGNASAGGPTVIAKVLMSYTRLRPGQVLLALDALIVASSVLVFGRLDAALYSLLTVVVTGLCIDFVTSSSSSGRLSFLFS